jgi:cytochrome c2
MAYDRAVRLDEQRPEKFVQRPAPAEAQAVATRRAMHRAQWLDEALSEAFVRRKEKYAAAVALSVAISATLTGTVWADERVGAADHRGASHEARQHCEALDKNAVGSGVLRSEAPPPNYACSDGLRSANIVWNEETLDKWTTNPQIVAQGAETPFRTDSPPNRTNVLAYLNDRAK